MAGRRWAWAGGFVALCCTAIMFYYAVVTGWCLHFLIAAVGGGLHGLATAYYLAKEHGLTDVAIIEKRFIGFGGAGPLHAARLGEKLGVNRILIPTGAGVGSAIGFLLATVAYEVDPDDYRALGSYDRQQLLPTVREVLRAYDPGQR